ncbi:hypothetical protein GCM10023195_55360 [Actinoallomurus liliacearum]|uniref:Uncharacterized protein n=1 Tax=Actinoallomurus liliacearum TaxID=1080073 RepID=A0ABP8TS92_9ACTN
MAIACWAADSPACADRGVQIVLDRVLGVVRSTARGVARGGRLHPQVPRIIRVAAELKTDQVVELGILQRTRHRPLNTP